MFKVNTNKLVVKDAKELIKIKLPDHVMGPISRFSNFDPNRIQDYKLCDGFIYLHMYEEDRIQAMEEFMSTVKAFQMEVERGVRPETEAYRSFMFDQDLRLLKFTVDKSLLAVDVSAKMIERSLVEDVIRYQVYSGNNIGVTVQYIDYQSKKIIEKQHYCKIN